MVERMLSMHEAQGSIPCSSTVFLSCFFSQARMAQWIRRLPTEQEILGSSPSMGFFFLGDNPDASVAERLRRWIQVPVNFVGVGSIPTGCTIFLTSVL